MVTLQISLKMFLLLNKVKMAVPWTYIIEEVNGEKIARRNVL